VPILRALREGLASDRIEAIYGIVNGTCNYVLTRMADEGCGYAEALAGAQAAGYAEADPALDVEGVDAAHKLAILATLAFGVPVHPRRIFTRGIARVEAADLRWADRFGHVVRHLAIAKDLGDALELRVHAAWVPRRWLLASVGGAFNAVHVRSRALGASLYYGRGAGSLSTGVAVVSDLIGVGRTLLAFSSSAPPPPAFRRLRDLPIRDIGDVDTRYYLRLTVADQPGVLARVAGALGASGISIAEVVQERGDGGAASLVILTHRAREGSVQRARAEIDAFDVTRAPVRLIRIEEQAGP
jgi:homoserine dehydrogenase